MNATSVQDLRIRSIQRGQGDLPQSTSNSSNHHRGAPPSVGRPPIPPRAVHSRRLDQHRLSVDFPIQVHRDIGRPLPIDDPVRSVDKVFNVYGERLRADLRNMHGVCTQLVAQEKQEAAKWYSLCAKVIRERDHARQRLNDLALEQNNLLSNSSSVQNTDSGRLASKRNREVPFDSNFDTVSESARSPSSIGNRPMKSLRLSPVHSPPASPSPGLSTSPPASSHSEFSPFEQQRPVQLRRSCDMASPMSYETKPKEPGGSHSRRPQSPPKVASTDVRVKRQPRTPSPLTLPTDVEDIASTFSHVDLMYVSAKGALVCRACLLEKSKSPPSFEAKAFPLSASWDELRDHCVRLHPEACADVARLQPAEIFELRRRLSL